MAKVRVAPDELRERLREQVLFLQSSARAFDEGAESEAKRLAVSIRVLVHDTSHSRSLLQQLGVKDPLQFFEIADPDPPGNWASYHGLVGVRVSAAGASFFPWLDDGPPHQSKRSPFKLWWTRYVFRDGEGSKLTRKDLVLALANKEGGAHVDPELDSEYARLSRENSLRYYFAVGDEPREWPKDPVPHSVRHIAHEVLKTLHDQVPEAGADAPHGWGWRLNGLP